MQVVKHIKASGYPVTSKKYKKAHASANKASLRKFGVKVAKQVNKIHTPKGELLGSHTKTGKIKVSSRVPKQLRAAIAYHEKVEHRLMTKRK